METSSNHQLREFLTVLQTYVTNSSYNLTENDFQVLVQYMGENDSFPENVTHPEVVNCGNRLRNWAEIYGRRYHPYCAVVICIFGTIANFLNIMVLSRKEMISAPINRILTALAVSDIILMVEYIPYVYYHHIILPKILDFSYIGAVYMLFHVHITQTLHTTSVCLTLMLAVWRYLTLGYPSRQNVLCSQFRCTLGITVCYLLSVIVCLPTYLTISITTVEIIENKTKYTLYHTDLSDAFKNDKTLLKINFWMYAVFIKLLPCCLLTVISSYLIRTLISTKNRKKFLRKHHHCYVLNEGDIKSLKMERRAQRTTKMLIAVLVLFLLTEFPQGIFALLISIKGKRLFLECYQLYGEVMDILALFSGAVNFILYCCMNRMFRVTFGLIFMRRVLHWNFKIRKMKGHPSPTRDTKI